MATKKKETTQLVVLKAEDLLPEIDNFDEVIENLQEMDDIEYPRIRFKRGKFFMSDDDDEGVEEFEAVVLYYARQNTYWSQGYDKNNITPPDCFSADGKTGSKSREGNKFGSCGSCYYNKFKSHPNGKGKACRNQIRLYLLRAGNIVPSTLFLAPTSLGAFTNAFLMDQVTQKGLVYWKVLTKVKAYQKDDETFFRVRFEVSGVYKNEELEKIKNIRDYWMETIKRDRERFDPIAEDDSEDSHHGTSSTSNSSGDNDSPRNREVKPKESTVTSSFSDDDDDPPF